MFCRPPLEQLSQFVFFFFFGVPKDIDGIMQLEVCNNICTICAQQFIWLIIKKKNTEISWHIIKIIIHKLCT
jgi:hypothetical protein